MTNIKSVIKALLISSNGTMLNIDDFIRAMPDQNKNSISSALNELMKEGGDTYDVIRVDEHYYVRTKLEYVEYIRRIKVTTEEPRQRKALIETLAVIAMRQPTSRSEIEDLRCVQLNVSILHDLQDYGWIKVVKVTNNDTHLYGTTLKFLQDFGLSSIGEFEEMCL